MSRKWRDERGFTLIEVLVATLVLVTGLLATLAMIIVADHATAAQRVRQAATSLAREAVKDARSLGYSQLAPATIAAAVKPLIPGATTSGTTVSVTRGMNSFQVSFSACSLDDPSDGYGSHTSPPASGGSWCPDVAANGSTDTNPDDYKRLSAIVTPIGNASTISKVQQTVLISPTMTKNTFRIIPND